MNRDQFNTRTRQAKGIVKGINGKLSRDMLLEKKGRAQKKGGRTQTGYGDFRDDIQGYNDHEDDIRGYGDFRDDLQKSG
ncbi:MAG: CsbD family protein [Sulfuricaulis sp.]